MICKLEKLNWKQIKELDRNKTIFFISISPLEEHGPHLPVGTDLLISNDLVNESVVELNEKRSDLNYVIIPSIPLGDCNFGRDFPGNISTKNKVIKSIIYSVISSLANHGFKYFIICTYHMSLLHLKGIHSAIKKAEKKYDINIYEPISAHFFNQLNTTHVKDLHAGYHETSLMKYRFNFLVDSSYKNLKFIYKDIKSLYITRKTLKQIGLKDGYIGSPAKASTTHGIEIFNETVDMIVDSTIKLYENKELPQLSRFIRFVLKIIW